LSLLILNIWEKGEKDNRIKRRGRRRKRDRVWEKEREERDRECEERE
jgi:hypothetical protein